MAYWLFKEEPTHYSFADLESDGKTIWDGVANNLALQHLRRVRKGDEIFFYHTGDEKAVVGIMEAVSNPYPDPNEEDDRLAVVEVRPVRRLPRPVTLAELKAAPAFADWELLRISRLSVMPTPAKLWRQILKLADK